MNPSSVSVILIVWNGEQFIADALASVFDSSCAPLETLVIDGGSTDRTREVVASFPAATFVPQQSVGLTEAYNEGIRMARGSLLAFISHDDCWTPSKLDRQVAFMDEHPDVLYTVGHVLHRLHDGATPPAGFRTELLEHPVPGQIMETLVARPACFARVGLLDPEFDSASDTDWFARARDLDVPMAVLPDTLVIKRVHGHNASLLQPRTNALLLAALRQSVGRKRNDLSSHSLPQ